MASHLSLFKKEIKMWKLTPLKTILKYCIDCSGFELKEVRQCPFDEKQQEECPLYDLRMGKGSRACLKRIRSYCMWCCCGQKNEVRLCPSVKCQLWVYRFGKRPQKRDSLAEILTTEGVLETEKVSKV